MNKKAGEALNLLGRAWFDPAIVDYHMPEMDGIALVRAMREVNWDIPIVVLTVDDRIVLAERFHRAGAPLLLFGQRKARCSNILLFF